MDNEGHSRDRRNDPLSRFEQDEWFAQLQEQHPIQAIIVSAIFQRLRSIKNILEVQLRTEIVTPEWIIATLGSPLSEIQELQSFLCKPLSSIPASVRLAEARAETNSLMAEYIAMGGRDIAEKSTMLEKAWLSNPRGRPSEKRILAVRAYELRLATPTLKWKDITNDVCNCNKLLHDNYCKESVRVAVNTLQKVLRKYDVIMPPLPSLPEERT